MTKWIASILAILVLAAPSLAQDHAAVDQAALAQEARGLAQRFAHRLREALQEAMRREGAVGALGVCQEQAPLIAEEIAQASGWQVGRTALRLRNQANGPDAWEAAGLREFQARAAAGQPVAGMFRAEVVEGAKGRNFRYLEAIPAGGACLACHGSRLAPEVRARIDELYPGDQATGFQEGDLRGAFSLSRRLP